MAYVRQSIENAAPIQARSHSAYRREAVLAARLERIEHLAHDLALDLCRRAASCESLTVHALADSIKFEIEAVIRTLNLPKR
jgi:hypothetical protein